MKLGPKYKICRRVGDRVFGKCQTTKFTVSGTAKKRIGKRPKGAPSEYSLQLTEKQKARFTYGLSEKQFSNYVSKVRSGKVENPTLSLYKLLESRLDNVIFRMGLASTRLAARQMVAHGHIVVNGVKVRIPSYQVKKGDVIKIRPGSRESALFQELGEKMKNYSLPDWVSFDTEKNEGSVRGEPTLGKSEANIDFGSILEFYSR